jgi:DNA-binding CsgD family transcriptional regulator
MTAVVGRDAELASLRDFVASISGGAVGFVLEGDAGMGKTTLWRAAVDHAQELGILVLQAQPVESETTLSFAGVGDLLDPVLDMALAPLPTVQRKALSRALAVGDEEGPAVEPRVLRVALLGAFRLLAEEGPALVAIDDSQWLDYASSAGLAYAVRRFRAEPVGLLLSRRSGTESALLNELLRSPVRERFTRVHVGALDALALGRVVQGQLGSSLPRPLLAEVHEASGGNPFYAVEIVRMLKRSDVPVEAGQPLPVPESLHELVHARLLALPPESRDYLLAAAAHAHATVALTEEASGVERAIGLAPAVAASVVELAGDRIHFTHPLLAAGAYAVADPLRRLAVHARLAELLDDPEARAWQLAASVTEPDEGVARELEQAAVHARDRGAPRPAALLLDRACELTPPRDADDALRRAVDAAYLHYESGDSPRAEEQLVAVVSRLPPGMRRARAVVRLARVRSYEAQSDAADLFLQAVAEAEGDPEILAVAHEGVATCLYRTCERLAEAVDHATVAAELALGLGDEPLAAEALGTRWVLELLLGRPEAGATGQAARALQPASEGRRVLAQPRFAAAASDLFWMGRLDDARHELEAMLRRAAELGDESSSPTILATLGQVVCELGQLASARAIAAEGQEASAQCGQRTLFAHSLAVESLVEAQCGRLDLARAAARRALELVPQTGGRQAELIATRALGIAGLSSGAPAETVAELSGVVAFARREAIAEPGAIPFVVDYIEALIELGRRDEADELLDWYEGNARRLARIPALADCARCRGLLAAQEGELDGAFAAFGEALELHEAVEFPLRKARTLLALGATQRRAKRRREARATLEQGLAVFEGTGAALWAERARTELARISGRAATPGGLTPAEERVATLVAEGKTNREVAAALYLSDRTVEGHLSRVFAKLGIRHRTEVAPALAARQTQGVAPSNTGDSPVSAGPSAP